MLYQCCSIHLGFNTALPETNQNEIELRFANEMHSAINAARKNVGVDILSLNGNFLVWVSVQACVLKVCGLNLDKSPNVII